MAMRLGETATIGAAITVEALERDPYPIYRRLREAEPVSWAPAIGLWLVTRWEDVRRVALDHAGFTAALAASPLNRTLGQTMMHAPEPYHAQVRATLDAPFHPAAVRRDAAPLIERLTDELIDGFAATGAADLVAVFAEPLAVRALRAVLGAPELPEASLRRWFAELATGGSNFENDPAKQAIGDAASREVDTALAPVLARLAGEPDGSVLARMLAGRAGAHGVGGGCPLTQAEIAANVKLMILGGMQEPRDAIGITLHALLDQPELACRIRADPALAKRAVEEGLRWCSPVGTLTREVTAPTEIAGVALPTGARVAAVIASANRDERHWRDPDRFDLDRQAGPHLAFGLGEHFCLGAWLARHEAMTALRRLCARLPNLRRDPDRPAEFRGWEFRGPLHLHALWDPA